MREEWDTEVLLDTIQYVKVKYSYNNKYFIISVVYARCNLNDQLELRYELQSMNPSGDIPWILGENLNVILNEDEKKGRVPFEQQEVMDFAFFINSCVLMEVNSQKAITLGGMAELKKNISSKG